MPSPRFSQSKLSAQISKCYMREECGNGSNHRLTKVVVQQACFFKVLFNSIMTSLGRKGRPIIHRIDPPGSPNVYSFASLMAALSMVLRLIIILRYDVLFFVSICLLFMIYTLPHVGTLWSWTSFDCSSRLVQPSLLGTAPSLHCSMSGGDQPRTNQVHFRWEGCVRHAFPDKPPPSIRKGKEGRKLFFLLWPLIHWPTRPTGATP